MSCRFLFACLAVILLGLGCSSEESTSTTSPTGSAVELEPATVPDSEDKPAPAEVDAPEVDAPEGDAPEGDGSTSAPEGDGSPVAADASGYVPPPGGDEGNPVGAEDQSWSPPPPSVEGEGQVAPLTDAVIEKYVDPEGGGSIEPLDEPVVPDGASHPSAESALTGVAKLMAGERFRWINGSRDVASGFYGIPVLLNVWSCNDKDLKGSAAWLRGLESRYSDHMVSVLLPTNDRERSLTSDDTICDLVTRPIRSHGIDLDGAVFDELGAKRSPAVYVYDTSGAVVASQVGPISAGSAAARKIEAAFNDLMAPVLKLRRTGY